MFGAGCQHEACGEQGLSAVWSSPLAGVWVFGAGCQHEASLLHPGKVAYIQLTGDNIIFYNFGFLHC